MKEGKVIFLHGATSSGKSTIAKQLQARLGQPFWHYSIDHLRESGVLPLFRISSGEFDWKILREPFFDGFHHSIAAFVESGNNLIVEHIIETQKWKLLLIKLLQPHDVFFVGLHCPLSELERREAERGDRPMGGARKDFDNIHNHMLYDLELDSTRKPSENVDTIIEAWEKRSQPSAFTRMAEE